MTRRLVIALAIVLLSGCSFLDRVAPPSTPVLPATPSTSGNELMAYLEKLKSLDEPALGAEAARQRRMASLEPSDLSRLKYAMALTLAPQSEEGDILAVVDPLLRKSGADPEVRAMARFLQGIAIERRRLKESAAAAGAKLRDERRARDTEKQRADAMQERAASLQQKLDALTDLEKSLSDRQNSTR
ncbi:MAG: hypothetical protein ACM3X5_10165, partial [Bacillota bacterium]